ncbi:MAG TPA: hypothetical protein VHS09_07765 [Polyangiaceae bacterium]|nr:hypothetical protein [Polyangiaceae bacterium]
MATVAGLGRYDLLRVDAVLLGGTGGALDVYLQRRVSPGVWLDWLHYAQLSAAQVANYSVEACASDVPLNVTTVGQMNDDLSVGAFALTAGTFVGGLPGDQLRLCAVAGGGTSAGATQSIYLTGYQLFT